MQIKPFINYMKARESVRLRKEAGQTPLIKDPILTKYKFTNVKREHDRTTKAFVNLYNDHQDASPKTVLLNCVLSRYIGTFKFRNAIGWQSKFQPHHLKRVAKRLMDAGESVFTSAYIIPTGGVKGPKIDHVIDDVLAPLYTDCETLLTSIRVEGTFKAAMRCLQRKKGFGGTGFMAKEVLLDTLFFPQVWQPSDLYTYTPIGIGARRGLNRLRGNDIKAPVNVDEAQADVQKLMYSAQQAFPQLGINMHDIQFTLCEFDKYERTRLGEGTPKNLYTRRP